MAAQLAEEHESDVKTRKRAQPTVKSYAGTPRAATGRAERKFPGAEFVAKPYHFGPLLRRIEELLTTIPSAEGRKRHIGTVFSARVFGAASQRLATLFEHPLADG